MDKKIQVKMTDRFREVYPGASLGISVIRNVKNPLAAPALDRVKEKLVQEIRQKYAGWDRQKLLTVEPLGIYGRFFRRQKKTYHVLLQLESIAWKEKEICQEGALVEGIFAAELTSMLLTSGHDGEKIRGELRLDIADGTEAFVRMNGTRQIAQRKDMLLWDEEKVLDSVLHGPERDTRIHGETRWIVVAVYCPPGVEPSLLNSHMDRLYQYVSLVSPKAQETQREILL